MYIAFRSFGNHTNQMYQFVQGDILAKKHGTKYVPFYIYHFFPYFSNLEKKYKSFNTKVIFPFLTFTYKVLNKLHLIKTYDISDLEVCKKLSDLLSSKKNAILDKWDFKGNEILFKGEDLLKEYQSYYKDLFFVDISSVKDKYISGDKTNIAVHIRRGDYIGHCGGKYYYDDETYCKKIDELLKETKTNNARIIIFTNDSEINKDFYHNRYDDVIFSNEAWQFDQQIMANCNYIIGAPSTFTMWASYIGNVPTYHIWEKSEKVSKDKFMIFTTYHQEV